MCLWRFPRWVWDPKHEHSVLCYHVEELWEAPICALHGQLRAILNVLGMTSFAFPSRALLQIFVTITRWYYGSWFLARQAWHTL